MDNTDISNSLRTSLTAPSSGSGVSALGTLDGDAFLKLFVAQLTYQNPLEPMDTSQMMAQTSQLTMVESLQKISEFQQQSLGYSQMAMATGLIGHEIVAIDADGNQISGTVGDVGVTIDGPQLRLDDGTDVPLSHLLRVVAPSTPDPDAASGTTT